MTGKYSFYTYVNLRTCYPLIKVNVTEYFYQVFFYLQTKRKTSTEMGIS